MQNSGSFLANREKLISLVEGQEVKGEDYALWRACRANDLAAAYDLIKKGATPKIADKATKCYTPLQLALTANNVALAALLIHAGGVIEPDYLLSTALNWDHADLIVLLINHLKEIKPETLGLVLAKKYSKEPKVAEAFKNVAAQCIIAGAPVQPDDLFMIIRKGDDRLAYLILDNPQQTASGELIVGNGFSVNARDNNY